MKADPSDPSLPSLDPQFDAFADNYDEALQRGLRVSGEGKEFFAAGRLHWLQRRLRERGVTARRILDFGCGTGTATAGLLQLEGAESLVGVDVSARSLAVARRHAADPRARFELLRDHRASADRDLVFCNGVFHHIPPEQRASALGVIHDSLRPGGWLALFENNPWNPGTRWIMSRIPFDRDARMLSAPAARTWLRVAGFEVVVTDFLFFFPRSLAWFRGLEPGLRGLPLGAQYLVLARRVVPKTATGVG